MPFPSPQRDYSDCAKEGGRVYYRSVSFNANADGNAFRAFVDGGRTLATICERSASTYGLKACWWNVTIHPIAQVTSIAIPGEFGVIVTIPREDQFLLQSDLADLSTMKVEVVLGDLTMRSRRLIFDAAAGVTFPWYGNSVSVRLWGDPSRNFVLPPNQETVAIYAGGAGNVVMQDLGVIEANALPTHEAPPALHRSFYFTDARARSTAGEPPILTFPKPAGARRVEIALAPPPPPFMQPSSVRWYGVRGTSALGAFPELVTVDSGALPNRPNTRIAQFVPGLAQGFALTTTLVDAPYFATWELDL